MSVNIFLAEDKDTDFKYFEEALSDHFHSFTLHRVSDGLACVAALKHLSPPDYIFLDLNMPLKSGIDCLAAIRSVPGLDDVPVVILSSHHPYRFIDMAYKAGASYFVVKPVNRANLSMLLHRLFVLLQKNTPAQKHEFVLRQMANLEVAEAV